MGIEKENAILEKYKTGLEFDAFSSFLTKLGNRESRFPCIPAVHGQTQNHFRYGFIDDRKKELQEEQMASLLKE
ncbi:YqcI/YcgG family protein [Bacillus alkalicellulosilyticus]|uniref:YqcI/YcgG family protein n=1 Tax=Alkalihalobacterium alkalicellulosilyticum TaxID=1912214 RepID=UPI002481C795|nr:YqcI/YcgG family protein [Bacillus alkalicellulosilyticus]